MVAVPGPWAREIVLGRSIGGSSAVAQPVSSNTIANTYARAIMPSSHQVCLYTQYGEVVYGGTVSGCFATGCLRHYGRDR